MVRHTWELPATDKNHPLQDSGSVGLKHIVLKDVAVGAHTQTIHT
jgi:hypothetical protein